MFFYLSLYSKCSILYTYYKVDALKNVKDTIMSKAMFELSTEWYKAHENTPLLEDTVTTYEELLNNRIGEPVRVYGITLDGEQVSIVHDEGVLKRVYRGEHNTKGLIQLKIEVVFLDPEFAPLRAKEWGYLYMPDFVRFVVDEDTDPRRAAVVEAWKEKQRADNVKREA